eukprot:768328_1
MVLRNTVTRRMLVYILVLQAVAFVACMKRSSNDDSFNRQEHSPKRRRLNGNIRHNSTNRTAGSSQLQNAYMSPSSDNNRRASSLLPLNRNDYNHNAIYQNYRPRRNYVPIASVLYQNVPGYIPVSNPFPGFQSNGGTMSAWHTGSQNAISHPSAIPNYVLRRQPLNDMVPRNQFSNPNAPVQSTATPYTTSNRNVNPSQWIANALSNPGHNTNQNYHVSSNPPNPYHVPNSNNLNFQQNINTNPNTTPNTYINTNAIANQKYVTTSNPNFNPNNNYSFPPNIMQTCANTNISTNSDADILASCRAVLNSTNLDSMRQINANYNARRKHIVQSANTNSHGRNPKPNDIQYHANIIPRINCTRDAVDLSSESDDYEPFDLTTIPSLDENTNNCINGTTNTSDDYEPFDLTTIPSLDENTNNCINGTTNTGHCISATTNTGHDIIASTNTDHGISTSTNSDHGISTTTNTGHGISTTANTGHGISTTTNTGHGISTTTNTGHGISTTTNTGHG